MVDTDVAGMTVDSRPRHSHPMLQPSVSDVSGVTLSAEICHSLSVWSAGTVFTLWLIFHGS